ncbi:hypothetical protein F4775DRAFT_602005 [Biscogniauxia sp. FL1348]|nr:hypothetical protein F4775DRAFT_602005 [Biscogniauxia sp. FL1348]
MSQKELEYAGERLRLVGSRVVNTDKKTGRKSIRVQSIRMSTCPEGIEELFRRQGQNLDVPEFEKTETASQFELFYDLWFVANLNVFTSIHDISNLGKFQSFIGYMVLLWTTWLITSIYDVRFSADSVLERCCKAIHLGVMVGFAEIGTHFDPNDQIISVFRSMSLFLAVSRFTLSVQYCVVALQIRKYNEGIRPMILTSALHLCVAAVYFGVSFRYDTHENSRVYLVWYIGGCVEIALHLGLSQLSDVLSFLGTHLGERMNLLTLVILGEGCIIVAKSITLLVKDTYVKDDTVTTWSPAIIGIVTSATALIYIIFQLYFDWMHEEHSMSRRHQVWWSAVHLPFHIALILLLEGGNQFILWSRINESIQGIIDQVVDVFNSLPSTPTSEEVSNALGDVVYTFLSKYQPSNPIETYESVRDHLDQIADMPDSFWTESQVQNDSVVLRFQQDLEEVELAMVNAVYAAFEIEAPEQVEGKGDLDNMQSEATRAILQKFILVFIYAFACAGIVLLFLTIMHIISKRRGWSPFNIFRTAICMVISICLALLSALASDQDAIWNGQGATPFIGSSWMLPTITISYFGVLLITHLPHPSNFSVSPGKYREIEEARDAKKYNSSHKKFPPPPPIPEEPEPEERGNQRHVSFAPAERTNTYASSMYSTRNHHLDDSPPLPPYDARNSHYTSDDGSEPRASPRPEAEDQNEEERFQSLDLNNDTRPLRVQTNVGDSARRTTASLQFINAKPTSPF